DAGRELAEAMIPLAMWGARHQMSHADPCAEAFRAEWLLAFLAAAPRGGILERLAWVHEFHVDDSPACPQIRHGRVSRRPGRCATPADVTVRATARAIAAVVGQKDRLEDAVAEGRIEVTGDPAAIATLIGAVEKRLA